MRASRYVARVIFWAWACGGLTPACTNAATPSGSVEAGRPEFQTDVRPVLQRFCFRCHGKEKQKADVALHRYRNLAEARAGREVWEKVLDVLQQHKMPPETKPQPTLDERQRIVDWIQVELFPVDCNHPDPGRVTIRRLNRAEYNHTIRDLVGVTFQPADDFPADDSGYGFDNIGDVLSLSPLLLEKYLAAAERILDAAIVEPGERRRPSRTFGADSFKATGGGSLSGPCCFQLFSQGEVFVPYTPPAAGRYRWRVRAYGQQAGPEPAKMAVKLDGRSVRTFAVKAVAEDPGQYELELEIKPGKHRLAAAFINDYYQPNDPNPANRDRNLVVQSFEVQGPLAAPLPPLPETHRRIFICQPAAGQETACARKIIHQFARRAFRRPVTKAEVTRLAQLAESARAEGESFEQSIKLALTAVLVSPHFLFRGELQPEPDNPRAVHPINEFALASRLSYFLWSSMPDDALFALAERGQLRGHLEPQVRRMLLDAKAVALVENFGGQWLQTRNLEMLQPDARTFPQFDPALRAAMRRETDELFAHILREDRSVLEFLTADYTFVNERLARHYGIPGVQGEQFRKVSLKGTGRGGVLTHASILTLTSNPTRTSPVKRGKWVLENLLDAAPPPPPPNVPALNDTQAAAAAASLRQRLEQHRADPLCASCHNLMDPIGFSFEHFDGIGAWRDKDGPFAIDASGRLNTGESFAGAAELRQVLATAKRDQFVRCFAEKLLTYALGRGLEYYDQCALDRIIAQAAQSEYRFSAFVLAIAKSVPFQKRRGEGSRLAQAER